MRPPTCHLPPSQPQATSTGHNSAGGCLLGAVECFFAVTVTRYPAMQPRTAPAAFWLLLTLGLCFSGWCPVRGAAVYLCADNLLWHKSSTVVNRKNIKKSERRTGESFNFVAALLPAGKWESWASEAGGGSSALSRKCSTHTQARMRSLLCPATVGCIGERKVLAITVKPVRFSAILGIVWQLDQGI